MGEAYGWNDDGRKVFDPVRLERAAADLRQHNTGQQLIGRLHDALLPEGACGDIPGGRQAHERLAAAFTSLEQELGKVGIDLADLASRTLAAAQLAAEVDARTAAAARRGGNAVG